MWDLVGDPEDRFSHNEAHISAGASKWLQRMFFSIKFSSGHQKPLMSTSMVSYIVLLTSIYSLCFNGELTRIILQFQNICPPYLNLLNFCRLSLKRHQNGLPYSVRFLSTKLQTQSTEAEDTFISRLPYDQLDLNPRFSYPYLLNEIASKIEKRKPFRKPMFCRFMKLLDQQSMYNQYGVQPRMISVVIFFRIF